MLLTETNYVDLAESAIKFLSTKTDRNGWTVPMVTTSKLRNLLSMAADIYNDVMGSPSETLSKELLGRIAYMKVRFYYEAGREPKVKDLLEKAKIFQALDEIGNSRANYIIFNRYLEALVAFHRYYKGKDI